MEEELPIPDNWEPSTSLNAFEQDSRVSVEEREIQLEARPQRNQEVLESLSARNMYALAETRKHPVLNEKIKKLIRERNELEVKSHATPRTAMTLKLSCADTLDSLPTYRPGASWGANLSKVSFQLEQLVKFNFRSRLAGDLGFLVYTKGGLGVTSLVPRLHWNFGSGYTLSAGVQLGERPATSVLVKKEWQQL